MAEAQSCTIAELLGVVKHPNNISNNELKWWQARSYLKPLPALREQLFFNDLTIVSNVNHQTNRPIFKEKDLDRKFYAAPDEQRWPEAEEYLRQRNEELKKKKENG
jgi:hypothetical protein